MESCQSFLGCSAPLCPLDADLALRVWYADEPVCKSQKHGKHRWIKKQRSIQRRETKSWFGKPVGYQDLFGASRKKVLSPEQIKKLSERMKNIAKIRGVKVNGA